MPMNRALEGKVYPEISFAVDAERVARFRSAVGDRSGGAVPPTFVTAIEHACFGPLIGDPELGLDYARVVHGEQAYEWHRPLQVGETVTARPRIASIRRKGGLGFLEIETEVRDAAGAVVVIGRFSLIERGAGG
ncbi:MAG: MaoC family dehydratase N-terminal domain-containing protein [Candidatus Velamenicoccus archaeovorus]